MKKEYIILVAVIIILGAYLALKKDNRLNYTLPDLTPVKTDTVDRIDITKGTTTVRLTRKDDTEWVVAEKAYPADKKQVDEMLATVGDLTLSALASETQDLERYDLGKDNVIHVTAFEKGKAVREFSIGKTAPSFRHTFVMLKGDTRIFQADKNFRDKFDKTADEFRDKTVLSFKQEAIKSLTLEKDGIAKNLVSKAVAPPEKAAKEGEAKKNQTPEPTWEASDGAAVDSSAVTDLLSSLSHLECDAFKDEASVSQLKQETPALKITLENGKKLRLSLFGKTAGDQSIGGLSSETPYAFDLPSYTASDIISYADRILGIKKEPKTADKD